MAPLEINWKKNLFFVWFSQIISLAGFGMCMPFISSFMVKVLHVSEESRGVYVSLYQMAGLVSLCFATTFWGILGDKLGRKMMLLRANYGAALLYPLLCFSPNVACLIGIRFLCSFFSGTVNPATTLLLSTTPANHHGLALGILSTATWSGNMIGQVIGGIIVARFGYTAAFLSCGALYLAGALMIQFCVQDSFDKLAVKKKNKAPLSWSLLNVSVITLMVLFVMMGLSRRIDQQFLEMRVELIPDNLGIDTRMWTGYISAFAATGGVIAGLMYGWLCDHCSLPVLLLPVITLLGLSALWESVTDDMLLLGVGRFFAYLFGGGIQPILMMWVSRTTKPELKGTFVGLAGSVNVFGGIIATFVSAGICSFIAPPDNVKWVFAAGGFVALLMIPLVFVTRHYSNPVIQENK